MPDSKHPFVSWHACLRWDERTPPTSVSPERAWASAVRVCGPERDMGGDETRVHRPTGTVLLRVSNAIVTVLDAGEVGRESRELVEPVLEEATV